MSEHRLAAIMFTDIAGYTALMGRDEDKAFEMLRVNKEIHETVIRRFHGTLVKEMGDGMLVSFGSASDAVLCAVEIMQEARSENIPLKIGIHEGEMVFAGEDVLGDGVNIASRLQEGSKEGFITISETVYHDVKNKPGIKAQFLEERKYKNVERPVKVYQVMTEQPGASKESEAGRKMRFHKWIRYTSAGLAVIILISIILWWKGILRPVSGNVGQEGQKSVAVIPFKNLSGQEETRYFCDGVMEAILNNLAKIADLRVPSRTSVEQFRDTQEPISRIAGKLNVKYVLEGSVQRYENTVRISLQLIDGPGDRHIWSEQYDREYKNILQVESELAQAVAGELNASISPGEKQAIEKIPTSNLTAYDYYLRARDNHLKFWIGNTDLNALKDAILLYRRALQADSTYSQAFSGLSFAFFDSYYNLFDPKINYADSMIAYSDKALLYNDKNEEAWLTKAGFYYMKGDYESALKTVSNALMINPNYSTGFYMRGELYSIAFNDYTNEINDLLKAADLEHGPILTKYLNELGTIFSAEAGFPGQARLFYDEAFKLSNDSIHYLNMLAGLEYLKNNFSRSLIYTNQVLQKEPNNLDALQNAIDCCVNLGRNDLAYEFALKYLKSGHSSPHRFHRIGYAFWKAGHKKESERYFNEMEIAMQGNLKNNPSDLYSLYDLAGVYAFKAEKTKALQLLQKFNKSSNMPYWWIQLIKIDPLFNNLRDDPEFQGIVRDVDAKYQKVHEEIRVLLEKQGRSAE